MAAGFPTCPWEGRFHAGISPSLGRLSHLALHKGEDTVFHRLSGAGRGWGAVGFVGPFGAESWDVRPHSPHSRDRQGWAVTVGTTVYTHLLPRHPLSSGSLHQSSGTSIVHTGQAKGPAGSWGLRGTQETQRLGQPLVGETPGAWGRSSCPVPIRDTTPP